MPDSIDVDIRMEKKEDEQDDAPFRCEVNVLVSDEDGRPLPGATIRIAGAGGSYDKEKPASDHGISTTFKDVPVPATLTVTETGYKEVSLKLQESDVNGDVTHGY